MGLSLRDQLIQAGFSEPKPEPKPAPKPQHSQRGPAPPSRGGPSNRQGQRPSPDQRGQRPDQRGPQAAPEQRAADQRGPRPAPEQRAADQRGPRPAPEQRAADQRSPRPAPEQRAAPEQRGSARPPQQPNRPDSGAGVKPAHAARDAKPNTAPREPKPKSGEPSLAHAYQIRAETEKREREEAQKRAQEEAQRKREQRLKLTALVAGQALNDRTGEHARNFFYGKKIRKVNVTPEQFLQLNAGELGVAQVDGRFVILTPALIRDVLQIAPQQVALFVPDGIGASNNPDDDYSDPRFVVPDDLVW